MEPTNSGQQPYNKIEKDQLNVKQRTKRLIRKSERDILQSRASNLKRAMNNCIDWQDLNIKPTRRFSLREPRLTSTTTTPCGSPQPTPPSKPTFLKFNDNLGNFSPLPDVKNFLDVENIWKTVSLSVTDDGSRRNSLLNESITTTNEQRIQYAVNPEYEFNKNWYDYSSLQPVEVTERNLLRTLQEKQIHTKLEEGVSVKYTTDSLQVPAVNFSDSRPVSQNDVMLPPKNIYDNDSIQHEKSSSDEFVGDGSDLLSTMSNEEASQVNVSDINSEEMLINDMDSFENSEITETLHGESMLDDINSVLGQDIFGFQENTMTSDDTTLFAEDEHFKTSHLEKRTSNMDVAKSFGFENRLFDLGIR